MANMMTWRAPACAAGDEYAQTRGGNNNWYGHDTKMTRFDWDALEGQRDNFFRFYRRCPLSLLLHCFFFFTYSTSLGLSGVLRQYLVSAGAALAPCLALFSFSRDLWNWCLQIWGFASLLCRGALAIAIRGIAR
jgi:hypothetical protein